MPTKTETEIMEGQLLMDLAFELSNNIVDQLEETLLDKLAMVDAMCDMDSDLLYFDLNSYDFYL
jgi:hypothetical protein